MCYNMTGIHTSLSIWIFLMLLLSPCCLYANNITDNQQLMVELSLENIIEKSDCAQEVELRVKKALVLWANGKVDQEPILLDAFFTKRMCYPGVYLFIHWFDEQTNVAKFAIKQPSGESSSLMPCQSDYFLFSDIQNQRIVHFEIIPVSDLIKSGFLPTVNICNDPNELSQNSIMNKFITSPLKDMKFELSLYDKEGNVSNTIFIRNQVVKDIEEIEDTVNQEACEFVNGFLSNSRFKGIGRKNAQRALVMLDNKKTDPMPVLIIAEGSVDKKTNNLWIDLWSYDETMDLRGIGIDVAAKSKGHKLLFSMQYPVFDDLVGCYPHSVSCWCPEIWAKNKMNSNNAPDDSLLEMISQFKKGEVSIEIWLYDNEGNRTDKMFLDLDSKLNRKRGRFPNASFSNPYYRELGDCFPGSDGRILRGN